jgi:Concanavalin A-like lectin/glucanases superfamily/Secretion system C-terminal sorting domain
MFFGEEMRTYQMSLIKIITLFCISFIINIPVQAQSGIYVGGPSYYDTDFSIDELKNSGFTTAIVWTIHINDVGNLNFNGEFLICQDGKYVGDQKYKEFPKNMALLKTAPTSINRLEIGLSGWGSSTFDNIKNLIATEGTGENSVLYRNFKALKEMIPAFDAVNFDDESTYDEPSSTQFAIMLADIGFKVTLVPYTAHTYWSDLAKNTNTQRPGTVDLVYLQCYAGGSGNSPCTWEGYFEGIPVYPGLWGTNDNSSTIRSNMESYKNDCSSSGGFIWLYDDFKNTDAVEELATAVNTAFGITCNLNSTISSPNPLPNANEIGLDGTISWSSGENVVSHDVYFGTSVNPEFVSNQTENEYNPGNLEQNKRYFWRINEINGTDTVVGNVYTFHTLFPIPELAENPKPENESVDIALTQSLGWNRAEYATSYSLYLGVNSNLAESDLVAEQSENIFVPPVELEPNTMYYWRVDGKNATGITTGNIWSFTTKDSVTEFSGSALNFNGTNSKVTIQNSTSLAIGGNTITLEAWINPASFKAETWQGSVILKDYSGGAGKDYGYGLRCGGQGQFDVVLGGGNWQELKSPQNSISLNIWTHIAATYDGSYIRLYVNGEEVADKRVTFNIINYANNVIIGDSPGFPGRVFNGKIDEARIWNIARTSDEITKSMNEGLGSVILSTETSGLIGYWSMDEGTDQQVSDKSSFGNHGVLGSSSSIEASDPNWVSSEVIVGVSDQLGNNVIPTKFNINQNYPNPFNPTTNISFSIPESGDVKLLVYDVRGRLVETLANGNFTKGNYTKIWDASNLSTGMYFINMSSSYFNKTIKTVLLK